MNDIFAKVRCASYTLNRLSETDRTSLLLDLADATEAHIPDLLAANANDLSRMDKDNPLYDRLQLTPQRLHDIASALRNVAHLDNPLGEVFDAKTLPNNLRLRKQGCLMEWWVLYMRRDPMSASTSLPYVSRQAMLVC